MERLKINLCVLICVFSAAYGCGSESGPGAAPSGKEQTAKPSPAKKTPMVKELLPNQKPGAAAPTLNILSADERQNVVVLPPSQPGGKGVTQAEIDAMKAQSTLKKPIDPTRTVVLPPSQPGGKGVTQAEIDAVKTQSTLKQPIDPSRTVVLPPSKPGGKDVTQAEIDAVKAQSTLKQPIDPSRTEVLPPSKPGGRGVTQAEIDVQRPSKQFYGPTGPPPPASR